jgi:hypothetical protein
MRVKTPSVTTSMREGPHIEARSQANSLADALAERLRHALGGGARGDAARLDQHQLAGR